MTMLSGLPISVMHSTALVQIGISVRLVGVQAPKVESTSFVLNFKLSSNLNHLKLKETPHEYVGCFFINSIVEDTLTSIMGLILCIIVALFPNDLDGKEK